MDKRERILRRIVQKCTDFARQLSYHRSLGMYKGEFKLNYWIHMFNNAIDLAVLDWFHLFGYHHDDLHWKKNVADIKSFKKGLLDCLEFSEDEWESYWQDVKKYRDKDIAHIEVRPVTNVPNMDIALSATSYYYKQVLEELSGYEDYSYLPKDLIDYYAKSCEQAEEITVAAYKATLKIKEKLLLIM